MLKLLSLLVPLASASIIQYQANVSAISSEWNATSNSSSSLSLNRPAIHFTPDKGWINDPNGLWYDAKEEDWHLYFQYNPESPHWDLPLYWGHAVSKDLTVWKDHGVSFGTKNESDGAFSGSMVIDYNNTSGFFNASVDPRQRVVAVWTLAEPDKQTQLLSYSHDGGYHFTEYEGNPVLDIDALNFRDPKVFWYDGAEDSEGHWIMAVAIPQKFSVAFYSSPDLKEWTLESDFTDKGFVGYQYECPGLVKVPYVRNTTFASTPNSNVTSSSPLSFNSTESWINSTSAAWNSSSVWNSSHTNSTLLNSTMFGNETVLQEALEESGFAWVLFLSINPGAPQGGSVNEYFIGDFNGTHFHPFDDQTRFVDLGKDFYAMQTFFNTPNQKDVFGIAWASNWQYGNHVPTTPWRSSMSLVRNFTVTEFNPNPNTTELVLSGVPVIDYSELRKNGTTYSIEDKQLSVSDSEVIELEDPTGVFEFSLEWSVNATNVKNYVFSDLSLYLQGDKHADEYLRLGFEANAAAFFIDRGHSNVPFVEENPFFTQRLSVNNPPSDYTSNTYDVYGVVDRNIIELYFNNGTVTSTNTFFFTTGNYISSIILETGVDDVYEVSNLRVNQFYAD
ncbi:unnamed protein product [Kluyveromyces dobzhanskii CBS 2104]|uniref:WGS project CCBQ000000000 data, contig 00107 n=1 Tax=Kluyveromyces dobzhanskii CBS 2104 TaxID=1427455 RepID=A0A0A8L139_9SACH|nr:unnamed protein product [Kluyveromyces dobzhanskii CBS 2104]